MILRPERIDSEVGDLIQVPLHAQHSAARRSTVDWDIAIFGSDHSLDDRLSGASAIGIRRNRKTNWN